jgi:hypothetical protein
MSVISFFIFIIFCFLLIGYIRSIYKEVNIVINSNSYYLGASYVKEVISSFFYKETITIGCLFFNVVFVFYKNK